MNAAPGWVTDFTLVSVFAMGLLAFALGAVVGLLYRLYTNSRVPSYAPVIVGLGAVGLWINSANALIVFLSGLDEEVVEPVVLTNIETNVVTAVVATLSASVGGGVGDRLAPNLRVLAGARQANREVSKLVRSVGRYVTVTLPDTIQTIDGYDPVTEATRSELAGLELVFPRGVTVAELRERISDRLREDYGVGHVDVEVNRDGEITHLALGRRLAGVGPTLPPRRVAVALTANPPPNASPGDLVQVWELPEAGSEAASESTDVDSLDPGAESSSGDVPVDGDALRTAVGDSEDSTTAGSSTDEPSLPQALIAHPDRWYRPDSERYNFAVRDRDGTRRYRHTAESAAALVETLYGDAETPPDEVTRPTKVAQAELRATNGDVATVVLDVNRLPLIDQSREYRLVTLPSEEKPENEFASLLRVANETMESIRIEAGSDLDGLPIGAFRPSIVAIRPRGKQVETLPAEDRIVGPGDLVYAIGRHDQIRKLALVAHA